MKYARMLGLGLMIAALALTGCNKKADPSKADDKKGSKGDEHAPHGKGPNGGVVFDFGKYHAELDIKHDKKEMYILILGNDEKTPVVVTAKDVTVTTKDTKGKNGEAVKAMTIKLKPVDEKDGKATKFMGTDDGLGTEAEHAGAITGEIDGKPASGEFKE
ncbi:Uncharacterized protein OS=Planctomyces maris DSM 8797 GN=PM8797T_19335 PE=4 SV=1 [Gemmataceae bacterium]|nr:Uncharacterized protein OS=Planctomyces maris DSM 8797 GN=PM8797T_19335 PE=4 SV=1 [Gemmataceae bacterium]VTU01448.1 Uncharacterized protein OS=Planctomyces maris DSM 8797 GN=PM8797T_19335 PE=4 SV=1 [Gemmataceae bacterium]